MPTDITARFRRWFDYEQDAHAKVFASFETVPGDRRESPEYRKAVGIFAHVVAARRVWLWRFGVIPASPGPLFPENPKLEDVSNSWRDAQKLWREFLESADDVGLSREFEYQSIDGGRFRNRIEDVLAQLFGHSWYHRGQIATLIRASGGEPAITDLIFWCREPV
jgi:uncharacterized damage-inducible protein DinB